MVGAHAVATTPKEKSYILITRFAGGRHAAYTTGGMPAKRGTDVRRIGKGRDYGQDVPLWKTAGMCGATFRIWLPVGENRKWWVRIRKW